MKITRAVLDRRIRAVGYRAPHSPWHIATFVNAVLEGPVDGCLVECGAFKGSSAAKFSHLAWALGKQLYVFDSFQGMPANDEPHTVDRYGDSIAGKFAPGTWAGTLDEVRDAVARSGRPEVVTYVAGWFADTLPQFREPVAAAYLDVDLAASTATCLEHLWPLVTPGGVIVSQDGDFPLTVEAMRTWAETAHPSQVEGLGSSKMVVFRK